MESTRGQDRGVPRPAAAGLTRAAARLGRAAERLEHAGAGRHRLLVAIGLLAPLLILYRGVLFAGEAWLDFDLLLTFQPRYRLLAAGLAEGRIPLWMDGVLGGFPVAFSEFGWFYPLTWGLLRVFEPLRAYFIETSLGLMLAAASAYGLGRVWGLSRRGAFLAAFLYAYSPFVFATARLLNWADIFFVLPAGLLAIERIAQGRRAWAVGLAVITGIAGLGGSPQIALLFVSVWLVYALFRLTWTWCEAGRAPAFEVGAWLLASVVLGLALGAVRFLPTIETTALSGRAGGLEYTAAAAGSIPPWNLVLGYLYPSFEFPRVLDETLNAEELLYLGILTPVLTLLALVAARRHRVVRFLAVLVVVAWVLAMGAYSLGFPLLHKLPLFSFFRDPSRFGIPATFGLAFLAAFGFELLPRPDLAAARAVGWLVRAWTWLAGLIAGGTLAATITLTGFAFLIVPYGYDYIDRVIVGSEGRFLTAERYYRTFDQLYARLESAFSLAGSTPRLVLVTAVLGALLIWAYRRGALRGVHAQIGVGAVLAVDLLLAPGHVIPTVPAEWYDRPSPLLAVSADDRDGRFFSYRAQAQKFELSTATGDRLLRDQRDLLEWVFLTATRAPNLALDGGPRTIDGYENLMPRSTAEFLAFVGSERAIVPGFASDASLDAAARLDILESRLGALAAANVRYITSGVPLPIEGLREVHAGTVPLPDWAGVEQPLYVYEIDNWRPEAWIARRWSVVDDPESMLEQLAERPEHAFVSRDPGIDPGQDSSRSDVIGPIARGPERIDLSVDLAAPGLLVLNHAPNPGWSAEVNGRPAEILTVNLVARGLALPAGAHEISMRFEPPGFAAGVVASLVATGLLAPLLALSVWRQRR
ncbi:MAG: hypothetical protein OXG33_01340 [Chloroflexi bacterium]|nr:hypothetical protein [Chloroflexota bacterium]